MARYGLQFYVLKSTTSSSQNSGHALCISAPGQVQRLRKPMKHPLLPTYCAGAPRIRRGPVLAEALQLTENHSIPCRQQTVIAAIGWLRDLHPCAELYPVLTSLCNRCNVSYELRKVTGSVLYIATTSALTVQTNQSGLPLQNQICDL